MRTTEPERLNQNPRRVRRLHCAGLLALCLMPALRLDAADASNLSDSGLPGGKAAPASATASPSSASRPAPATGSRARLLFPDQVLAGFTNGQERVAIIVNLVPPPRALLPTDWNAPKSLQTLHAANRGAAEEILKALGTDEHKLRFRFDNQAGFSCEVTLRALEKLLNHPQVDSIELVHELQAHLAQGIPLMNASASRSTYNGSGIAIAICDTGIDYNHPRLGGGGFPNSKVIGGYDFGDSDADPIPNTQAHGTCCAGIAAGNLGTVGDYVGGVAPAAKLYACKISYGTTGSAYNDAMVAAWDWCVTHRNDDPTNPIMVISTSFGGGQNFSACDSSVTAMTTAANNAVAAGITVLASSGNDGYCDSIAWPACISSVISVGAVYDASFGTIYPCVSSASCAPKTASGGCATHYYAIDYTQPELVTSYANVASFLDLFAPGNQCYTTDISGSTGYSTGDYDDSFGGTSASCPYAAGAVACLQHAARARTGAYLTPAEVRSRLAATGDLVTDTKVAITKPRVNLGNAIATMVAVPRIVLNASAVTAEGCLPANGGIDPYEAVTVSFALENTGSSNTANVVATLLATNGVTLPSAPQTYGAIIAGGAAVTRTFTFTAAGACGGGLAALLQLQDGTNYLGTVTNSFTLGALGSPVLANYSSGAITVAIPDRTTVEVPIATTDDGIVADVNVRVRLNHTRDSDLVISLVHPDGTVVTLANQCGDKGDNYGSGPADCSGTFTVFDDAGSTSIASGTAPFEGTYKPEQLLSGLNGKSVTGTWKLRVADTAPSQTGTIYCFQLDINRRVYACCTGASADLGLVMIALPDPVTVGSNLTYSLTVTNLGPAQAAGVTVTDALPTGLVFVSASVSQGTWATNGGSLFTCALGDINANGSAIVSLVASPNSAGSIANTAIVSSSIPDPSMANNTATAVTAASEVPPTITQPPQPQNVCPGATATFTVAATGTGPLSYQWQTNNVNLTNGGHYSGVTTSNLTVSGADGTVLGDYRCVVSNQGGSTPSSAAALTINDTAPPTITCPPDVTVSADAGTCTATNVALGSPVTGDNCGVALATNDGPLTYALGTNLVTWTVTDTSGNTNSCQQRVIVLDSEAPTIAWYMTNVVVAVGTNCQAFMPDLTGTNYLVAADNCSSVIVTQSVTTNTALSLGTNEVVLGALDAAGNVAYCTNYVVVADQTPPTMTCPTNLVVNADAGQCSKSNVTWEVVASDNCAVTNLVSEPPSGSTLPAGVTTVRCTATDASGNTNLCSFTVTVIAPTYILAQPISQTVTQGLEATFTVTATNDCGSTWAYQWRFNDTNIAGATSSSYTLTNAQPADAGSYSVIVTNATGSAASSNAVLTVIPTNPAALYLSGMRLANAAFEFVVNGVAGRSYGIQFSTNLFHWEPLRTVTLPAEGSIVVSDAGTVNEACRFYRAVECVRPLPPMNLRVVDGLGQAVTLAWDPSPGTNLIANYRVYYGTASSAYTSVVSAGPATSATISNLVEGTTYYFAATTVDISGWESDFSGEVSVVIPVGVPIQPPTLDSLPNLIINEKRTFRP